MYQIMKMDGTELGMTDSVHYIKISGNGCFINTTAKEAIGIAYQGVPYNLMGHSEIEDADTVFVSKRDSGFEMKEHRSVIEGLIQTVLEG